MQRLGIEYDFFRRGEILHLHFYSRRLTVEAEGRALLRRRQEQRLLGDEAGFWVATR
jgi:hypothetical protein